MAKLIIFSAPSGSGKSTIINYLLTQNLNLAFSISATSRPPRGTEKDMPGGRLRAADVPDAVSVRKWSRAGPLAGCTGRRRAGVLALHGCKWAAGERKACTICGICWF